MKNVIPPLLEHLDKSDWPAEGDWNGWTYRRILGGANNILFRATNDSIDCAIKFTIRDSRSRAGREYSALAAVHDAELCIAPTPLLLDSDHYSQPVVVQSWLEGAVTSAVPATDTDWRSLIEHYAAIHSVTPEMTVVSLARAVINADSVAACKTLIRQQLAHIPVDAQPHSLRELTKWLDEFDVPEFPKGPTALCRVDANTDNFIRRSGRWASVDWENSGWGDPAFEMADLMTHPAYLTVTPERWKWVIDTYCRLRADADPTAADRIPLYYKTMLIFWVARLARMLYEIPLGLDQRLVARPPDWEKDTRQKYALYLERAGLVMRRSKVIY